MPAPHLGIAMLYRRRLPPSDDGQRVGKLATENGHTEFGQRAVSGARSESQSGYKENTNNMPPHDVYFARSGRVVPRSRTSYGRFDATSPAMSKPISPPMPE